MCSKLVIPNVSWPFLVVYLTIIQTEHLLRSFSSSLIPVAITSVAHSDLKSFRFLGILPSFPHIKLIWCPPPLRNSVAPISDHNWLKLLPGPYHPLITGWSHLNYLIFSCYPPIFLILINFHTSLLWEDNQNHSRMDAFYVFLFTQNNFPPMTPSSLFSPCIQKLTSIPKIQLFNIVLCYSVFWKFISFWVLWRRWKFPFFP